MKHSDAINELAAALAKAQGAMGNAPFNKVNPHFKSKYADLASVRDTVTPHLSANGLSLVQVTVPENGSLLVVTSLIHSSGQWLSSEYPILCDVTKPQAMASSLSYARRYSISCICGIASEEDDDANEANDAGKTLAVKLIDETQFRYLQDLIEKAEADEPKLLAYLKAKNLESMTQAQFKEAEAALRKKLAAKPAVKMPEVA
jgi:hypothetical protein